MALFPNTPQVTRNILIVNILFFVATFIGERSLNSVGMSWFALYPPGSPNFRWWQFITYMFMHGSFWHIFFNMYTLWVFGSMVERIIGPRKFVLLYGICGVGAAMFHIAVTRLLGGANVPMVGASGAIYGLLVAYAMLFPSSRMTLIFPPITLSAKWMVVAFAGIELLTGVLGTAEGIAHFAHLGGMVVGMLLLLVWKREGRLFNQQWW